MIGVFKRKRLIKAVRGNKLKTVESLINGGVDPLIADKKGRSLLAIAYNYNSTNVIEFLRSKGLREEINELYNYAVRCFNRSEFEEAKLRFRELTNLLSNNSKIHYYLGNSIFNISQHENTKSNDEVDFELLETSVFNIEKSLELNDEDHRLDKIKLGQAFYILGFYYYHKQNFDEASKFVKNANDVHPENEGVKFLIKQLA